MLFPYWVGWELLWKRDFKFGGEGVGDGQARIFAKRQGASLFEIFSKWFIGLIKFEAFNGARP